MRAVRIVAVNLVVCAIVAELVALIVFYNQTGWLFYSDPYKPTYATLPETARDSLTSDGLHPYFGPTHAPGIPFDVPPELRRTTDKNSAVTTTPVPTNNFGFVSPHPYPYAKTNPNQFVIGIFGGSVGLWFCQVGADRLLEDLRKNPAYAGKELIPLCFSHEGYKQPQQLLVLAYFLSIGQAFDLVINIDGFNEVALSNVNRERGLDISMPSAMHLEPLVNVIDRSTLTPKTLELLARIARDRERLNATAARLNRTRFASVYLVLGWYHAMVDRRYRAELLELTQAAPGGSRTSLVRVTPPVKARTASGAMEDVAAEWSEASVLMNDLLRGRGVPYFHFLQPNQYFTRRAFRDEEAKVALSPDSPFKPGAEAGYPALLKAAASGVFERNHVAFFDATRIFDSESSPVFIDNCCHYTLVGNDRLADFIAASMASASVGSRSQAAPH